MTAIVIDLSQTLEQLCSVSVGDPDLAPTHMIAEVWKSWKTPLRDLTNEEIGRLVVQHDGYPHILDLVWPKLESDPLFDGGYYPGDVLSNLIRADPSIWANRPSYRAELEAMYRKALARPYEENDAFLDSLGLPHLNVLPQ